MTHRRPEAVRLAVIASCLAALAAACGGPPAEAPSAEPAPAVDPGLTEGRHAFVTTDGVEMPYFVSGDGDTTVLMIHCWMCDHSFWAAQVPVLRERYRVITLDLPGHGEAGDNRKTWRVEGFGEDVAGLIDKLDLHHVMLVGHSMGGPVALKAAALSPGRVEGIVAVDTLQNAEFKFDDKNMRQAIAAFEADFRTTCSNFVDHMFPEEDSEAIKDEVRRKSCEQANAEAGIALISDFLTLDFPKLFREAGVPIRGINAAAPMKTEIDINRKYADYDAVVMEGVGHYLYMTRPQEFNRLLLQALDELTARAEGKKGTNAVG